MANAPSVGKRYTYYGILIMSSLPLHTTIPAAGSRALQARRGILPNSRHNKTRKMQRKLRLRVSDKSLKIEKEFEGK